MRKYVHRVGRTARAGREGDAWTLVEQQEVHISLYLEIDVTDSCTLKQKARYFKQMMKDADHFDRIRRIKVNERDLEPLLPYYAVCRRKLLQYILLIETFVSLLSKISKTCIPAKISSQ